MCFQFSHTNRSLTVTGSWWTEGSSGLKDVEVRHQRGPIRRAQVATTATGTDEAAGLRASGIGWQHVESRRSCHTRHEHCAAIHEGMFPIT